MIKRACYIYTSICIFYSMFWFLPLCLLELIFRQEDCNRWVIETPSLRFTIRKELHRQFQRSLNSERFTLHWTWLKLLSLLTSAYKSNKIKKWSFHSKSNLKLCSTKYLLLTYEKSKSIVIKIHSTLEVC